MTPRATFSRQTVAVLATLSSRPADWQHGYALAKQTELKSGTLYPILIRLADRGLVEARWQEEPEPGRPRRHLYRLTGEGLAAATAAMADEASRVADSEPSGQPRPRATAGRGRAVRGARAPVVNATAVPWAG